MILIYGPLIHRWSLHQICQAGPSWHKSQQPGKHIQCTESQRSTPRYWELRFLDSSEESNQSATDNNCLGNEWCLWGWASWDLGAARYQWSGSQKGFTDFVCTGPCWIMLKFLMPSECCRRSGLWRFLVHGWKQNMVEVDVLYTHVAMARIRGFGMTSFCVIWFHHHLSSWNYIG